MTEHDEPLQAEALDAAAALTLLQLCRVFDVHADYVIELVEVGVVEPAEGHRPAEWRFPAQALVRMRRALRWHRELAVDPAGAALALDLLEEVEMLRARLRALDPGGDG